MRWQKETTSKRTLWKTEQPHRRAAQEAMSIVLDVSNKVPGGKGESCGASIGRRDHIAGSSQVDDERRHPGVEIECHTT